MSISSHNSQKTKELQHLRTRCLKVRCSKATEEHWINGLSYTETIVVTWNCFPILPFTLILERFRRLKKSYRLLWKLASTSELVAFTLYLGASSGFPGSSPHKVSACNAEDPGSIPGSGRSDGEWIGNPFQYSLASLLTQMVKNLSAIQETRVQSLVGKIPWRREWLPTPVFWPGEFHGQRRVYSPLVGYSPWGSKELDMTEGLSFHFPLAASKQALTRVFFHLRQTECSAPSSLIIWV